MKKLRGVLLCIVGVISIGLSITSYSTKKSLYEFDRSYGGDAYTGIQNAAATTSRNVAELKDCVKFGFGSVLLITGLSLLAFGVTSFGSEKQEEKPTVLLPAKEGETSEVTPAE